MKKLLILGLATLLISSATTMTASYYSDKYHLQKTASGEIFHQDRLTCASNVHRLGDSIRVTNIRTGKSVDVKVTDRLPKKYSNRIDLSKRAFKEIAPLSQGLVKIKVERI